MDNNRNWKILNWNIRGINSDKKWNALSNKIDECGCDIICLQETKRENFDSKYIKNFCPKKFSKFAFVPSMGASGGLIIIWNGALFDGTLEFQNDFSISVKFTSNISSESSYLTNIYGPSQADRKDDFLQWFSNISMPDDTDWLIMGDFNFIRSPNDRNKPGGNISEMFKFNEAISNLGLVEIPLKGRKFTWSNMQVDPLLEKLDWVFSSASWTSSFPSTIAYPLVKPTSDHNPCVISIGTKIPKAKIFRFENYWMNHESFKDIVKTSWDAPVPPMNSAKRINTKLKNLRRILKNWVKNLPCLKKLIKRVNETIELLDIFEELRPLSTKEGNLRDMLKSHVLTLLQNQRVYWKQRGKIKWVNLGSENTKFFHTKATINYRHNFIGMISNDDLEEISDHDGKASILWKAFKERMGKSENTQMLFNLESLYGRLNNEDKMQSLEVPFSDQEIEEVFKNLPNDKSPGPDGFNNEFIKCCWPIIGQDIKDLIMDFYEEKISLESINSSLITLIPKCQNPTNANDFRPISFLNSVLKIITKLLANRPKKLFLNWCTKTNMVSSKIDQFRTVWDGLLNTSSSVTNQEKKS
jgi:exonuclease III